MRPTALKPIAAVLLFLVITTSAKAQVDSINVVTSAVPFLRISPDARSGGMGDVGVATSPDANAGFWNAGKVAFNKSRGSISATYTPWLKDLVNDIFLASLNGYFKFDDDQAIYGSLRYFSLGDIRFTDAFGAEVKTEQPREFGVDVGYSRRLNSKNGIGVALRYINSNLADGFVQGSTTYKTGNSVAADLGWYHDGKKATGKGWTWGIALNNLGAKIGYTNNADEKDFIPANLGLGATHTWVFNAQNQLTFGLDVNKLLVPSLPQSPTPQELADYRSKGVVGSWFSSFSDSEDGFGEELKEFQISTGAEYWYNNQFAFRLGYFHETKQKGNRRYFTTGLGLKYNLFSFNFSYLLPSGQGVERNPLSNTLRFSVMFDFGNGGEKTKADK